MAERIQRRRIKGWKMPAGAVNCTRPGRYSNPYRIGEKFTDFHICIYDAEVAVLAFKNYVDHNDHNAGRLLHGGLTTAKIKAELRGKDLICWCALDAEFCHVDVLLEIANA